jgi:hypothetical protein
MFVHKDPPFITLEYAQALGKQVSMNESPNCTVKLAAEDFPFGATQYQSASNHVTHLVNDPLSSVKFAGENRAEFPVINHGTFGLS